MKAEAGIMALVLLVACDPCIAVTIVDASARADSGIWTIPADVREACPSPPEVPAAWRNLDQCSEEFAYYAVRHWEYAIQALPHPRERSLAPAWTNTARVDTGRTRRPQLRGPAGPRLPGPRQPGDVFIFVGPSEFVGIDAEIPQPTGVTGVTPYHSHADSIALLTTRDELAAAQWDYATDPIETAREVVVGACTATLIASRYVLTARHCITATRCDVGAVLPDHVLVFGHRRPADERTRVEIEGLRVVGCGGQKKLARREQDDWAVLELPRAVVGRAAVPIAKTPAPMCTSIFALGFPLGRPLTTSGSMKRDEPDAWITDPRGEDTGVRRNMHFTTLDALPGMSGAPVFDEAGRLVGMLTKAPYSQGGSAGSDILACPAAGCIGSTTKYARAIPLDLIRTKVTKLLGAPPP